MSVKTSHELKQLQSRKEKLLLDVDESFKQRQEADRQYQTIKKTLDELNQQILRLQQQSRKPVVTEHALLRYCERVKGIDLEKAKEEILSEEVLKYIDMFGSGTFRFNGIGLVVKDRSVITIID